MNKTPVVLIIVLMLTITAVPSIVGLQSKPAKVPLDLGEDLEVKIKGGFASKDFHKITLSIKNNAQKNYEFPLILIKIDGLDFSGGIWNSPIIIDGTNEKIIIEPGLNDFEFDVEKLDIPNGFGFVLYRVCFYLDLPGVQDADCFIEGLHLNDLMITKQTFYNLENFDNQTDSNGIFQNIF